MDQPMAGAPLTPPLSHPFGVLSVLDCGVATRSSTFFKTLLCRCLGYAGFTSFVGGKAVHRGR